MLRALLAAIAVFAFTSSAMACGAMNAQGEAAVPVDTAQTTPAGVDGKSTPIPPKTDG